MIFCAACFSSSVASIAATATFALSISFSSAIAWISVAISCILSSSSNTYSGLLASTTALGSGFFIVNSLSPRTTLISATSLLVSFLILPTIMEVTQQCLAIATSLSSHHSKSSSNVSTALRLSELVRRSPCLAFAPTE